MHRVKLIAGVTLLVAIPLGFLGAWAFNPDSGWALHSEVLWRIFGIMCEGGVLLVLALVVLSWLARIVRRLPGICRSTHA